MQFTNQEMGFLCRLAHFDKMLGYGVFPLLNKNEVENVISSLKEKNILDDNIMTEQGLALIKFITLYNNAKKFIKIGSINFANYQDKEYVMVTKREDNFLIDVINQDGIIAVLLAKFSDNYEAMENGEIKRKFITNRRFTEIMRENENAEAIYYFRFNLNNKEEHTGVLYILEKQLYHYDSNLEELVSYPRNHVQKGIESIFWRGE